jgi:hypothetical protein
MSPRRVRHMSEQEAKAAHFAKMEKVAECIHKARTSIVAQSPSQLVFRCTISAQH